MSKINFEIKDWSIDKDPYSSDCKDMVLTRSIYDLKNKKENICCSISSRPNLFNLSMINNYYLEIFIEKKDQAIARSYNPDNFRSFKTLFEAILYADLYLRDIGILNIDSISYKKEWEDLL